MNSLFLCNCFLAFLLSAGIATSLLQTISSPRVDTALGKAATKVCLSTIADLPTLIVIRLGVAPNTSIGVPAAGSEARGYPVLVLLLSLSQVNTKPPVLSNTYRPTDNPWPAVIACGVAETNV